MTNIELTRQISLINGRLNAIQSEIDCFGFQSTPGTGTGSGGGSYVPLTRTITINGDTKALDSDLTFTLSTTGGSWGTITGNINNQTDLLNLFSTKANVIHTHIISDISGLQTALNSKQPIGDYAPLNHIHDDRYYTQAEIDSMLINSGAPVWGGITGTIASQTDLINLFSGKADVNHNHTISDIAGLQTTLDNKSNINHSHIISDVSGLQTSLDSKAPIVHTHAISDVVNLQSTLDTKLTTPVAPAEGSVIKYIGGQIVWGNDNTAEAGAGAINWVDVQNKPTSFNPSPHTHVISDVTNLQAALDGKANTVHTHVISDTSGLQAALDAKANLLHTHAIADVTGLQTALNSKQAAGSYAPLVHTHVIADVTNLQSTLDNKVPTSRTITIGSTTKDLTGNAVFTLAPADIPNIDASKITTGILPPARLGTGTPSGVTVLFGDGSYKPIPSAAPVTVPAGVTSYTVPAGTLIQKIVVLAPTDTTFKIGTTAGGNDYLDTYTVTGGYSVIDIADYMLTTKTLYFTMASNASLKIYIQ